MIKIDPETAAVDADDDDDDDDDDTTTEESVKDVTEKSNDLESIKSIEQERIVINITLMGL